MSYFVLAHDQARQRAQQAIKDAQLGYVVTIKEPKKKRIQEEKYHAMIGDIARQTLYAGKRWNAHDMKRILIDEFSAEMRQLGTPLHQDSRIIPSENGQRIIQLEIHSSNFYVKEACDFIEFLYSWGCDRLVIWAES